VTPLRRLLVALFLLPLLPGTAAATPEKCRVAILKASAAFVQTRVKALEKCEQAKLAGKLPLATRCTAEPKTSAALAKNRAKLVTAVAKACGGGDKLCGGLNAADDESLAAIGWTGACPDFETGDCTNPIQSCADIPTCLACVHESAVDQSLDLVHAALAPTDPKTKDKGVKALRKCQATIGKATATFLAGQSKILTKCWSAVSAAGAGACPDATAAAAVAAASAKQAATIAKACAGPDKMPGTGDDIPAAAIGSPASCLDVAPVGGASCTRTISSAADLAACAACVSQVSSGCNASVAVPGLAAYPPECNPPTLVRRECAAQRTVHVVAGTGSLAWFTQVWPVPAVITGYTAQYAFDDPAKAEQVPGTGAHPLYARLLAGRRVFEDVGAAGEPSIFVAGNNQTHTNTPNVTTLGSTEVVAAGAALQAGLATGLPVLTIGSAFLPYGPAPNAPPAANVASVAAAISALKNATTIAPEVEQALAPSAAQLTDFGIDGSTPAAVATFAQNLIFAANAFRFGLVATVVMPHYNDDPHGAFDAGFATARADGLARILDRFYAELAAHRESRCRVHGTEISLADNTVLVVSGDTFKNPFNRAGWSDGTPGNSNLLYVRSNGYLRPGWFGAVSPAGRSDFSPTTGDIVGAPTTSGGGANLTAATNAAQLGALFAISRGDTAAVAAVAAGLPYTGVVAPALP
jgi:hypothetical protein